MNEYTVTIETKNKYKLSIEAESSREAIEEANKIGLDSLNSVEWINKKITAKEESTDIK
jgi:hypothetical protein